MKLRTTILFLFALSLTLTKAQSNRVYYYEKVKTVRNGNQQTSSGDGHYLAINNNGLYECNENGGSMSKGFVKYINSNNNKPYYEGNAYLGSNLMYVFNEDYSRLNLHLGDGTIYVYARRQSPSSSAALRSYSTENVPIPAIGNEDIPSSPNSNTTTPRTEQKTMTCPYCNGSGRRLISTNGPISRNQYWVTCGECGQRHLNTTGHRHVSCVYCNGTGRKRL